MKKEKAICCKIENCLGSGVTNKYGKIVFPRSLCNLHYQKYHKYGSPIVVKNISGEDRSKNELYNVFHKIKSRCYNKKDKAYKNYGGRGIEMSDEFLTLRGFDAFVECMGERPSKNHTVDRIDNDKNYERKNLKWSTNFQQAKNRRNNNEFVGVYWYKSTSKWKAVISINRKPIHLGYFVEYSDACAARRAAEIKYNVYEENLGTSTINP